MKKTSLLILTACAVSLLAGCASGPSPKELEARIAVNEDAIRLAQSRADEAHELATYAVKIAERSQQTANETNERTRRILERSTLK